MGKPACDQAPSHPVNSPRSSITRPIDHGPRSQDPVVAVGLQRLTLPTGPATILPMNRNYDIKGFSAMGTQTKNSTPDGARANSTLITEIGTVVQGFPNTLTGIHRHRSSHFMAQTATGTGFTTGTNTRRRSETTTRASPASDGCSVAPLDLRRNQRHGSSEVHRSTSQRNPPTDSNAHWVPGKMWEVAANFARRLRPPATLFDDLLGDARDRFLRAEAIS